VSVYRGSFGRGGPQQVYSGQSTFSRKKREESQSSTKVREGGFNARWCGLLSNRPLSCLVSKSDFVNRRLNIWRGGFQRLQIMHGNRLCSALIVIDLGFALIVIVWTIR
jgi:hypothetical protein